MIDAKILKKIKEQRETLIKRNLDANKKRSSKFQEQNKKKSSVPNRVKLKPVPRNKQQGIVKVLEERKEQQYYIGKQHFHIENVDDKKQAIIKRANQAINGSQKPKHLEALNVAKEHKLLDNQTQTNNKQIKMKMK